METIVSILMKRDGMNLEDAEQEVNDCREDLLERVGNGEMCEDICQEWFGLEPDYLMQLM